jgi:hypothetical protein
MQAGSVLLDSKFEFSDGTTGQKIFVVLTDITDDEVIVVKTTSNSIHKCNIFGCNHDDRYPNFFLPLSSCHFVMNTWIMLDEYFSFSATDLVQKISDIEIEQKFVMSEKNFTLLLECCIDSEDISGNQAIILQRTLDRIDNQ